MSTAPKVQEPPASTPVDPIGAAVAKYRDELTLPPLNAASPDEVLIAYLHRGGSPTTQIQQQVMQAHQHARMQRYAPRQVIDARMADYARKLRDYQAGNTSPGSRNVTDWRCAIASLRFTLETLGWLIGFTVRWEKMSDGDRQADAHQQIRDMETQQVIARCNAVPVTHHRDWNPFLNALRARGVVITPGNDGTLQIHGGRLQPQERAEVAANKAAIHAALSPVEVI